MGAADATAVKRCTEKRGSRKPPQAHSCPLRAGRSHRRYHVNGSILPRVELAATRTKEARCGYVTQKRPESGATLEVGRSYTQHAPTTQHEVAAVYPIPPCFEVGQRFRDASSPGLPWALFSIFFVAHTRRDSNLRRPPSTWEISPEVPCSEL